MLTLEGMFLLATLVLACVHAALTAVLHVTVGVSMTLGALIAIVPAFGVLAVVLLLPSMVAEWRNRRPKRGEVPS